MAHAHGWNNSGLAVSLYACDEANSRGTYGQGESEHSRRCTHPHTGSHDQEWDVHRFRGPSEFPPCLDIHTVAHTDRVNRNISDDVHTRTQDHMIKNETWIDFEGPVKFHHAWIITLCVDAHRP